VRGLELIRAQVAFLGVPYDAGTPQPGIPTGQRARPAAARDAGEPQFYYPRLSADEADPGATGWYDVEADRDYLVGVTMVDVGDVAIQGSDTDANYERIRGAARGIAERGALMWRSEEIIRSAIRLVVGWSPWASSMSYTSTRTPTSSTNWTEPG
jgi:hypothetical protein